MEIVEQGLPSLMVSMNGESTSLQFETENRIEKGPAGLF